jgi:histidinol-phosphate aminotransferase
MPDAPLHLIRPEVRAERAYRVPTEADAPAKLDQNESPFDVPEALKQAVAERFCASDWNRYPDDRPHRLIAALADQLGHPADGIIVGRGSNEITHTLGLCFLGHEVPVVLPHPMFALYASVARMHGARIISVDPEPDFSHDPATILAAAQESNAALSIVTTPNNPTGQVLPFEGLERLIAQAPGAVLVDEAYHEFVPGPSAVDLLGQYPNLLIMRTFSKAMGLAGLRLGILLGDPALIQEIEKARLPFLVDRFSEAVALELMERPDLVTERVAVLTAERNRMLHALADQEGIEALPGAANFFLMRTPLACIELRDQLAEHGVRIRDVSGYPALAATDEQPGWVRVSVGTPVENQAFLDAVQQVLTTASLHESAG